METTIAFLVIAGIGFFLGVATVLRISEPIEIKD